MRYRKNVMRSSIAVSRTDCDFCKQKIERPGTFNGDDVTIQAHRGRVYPECDTRQVERVDCCDECWDDKVRPALEALGATFYEGDAENLVALPLNPDRDRHADLSAAREAMPLLLAVANAAQKYRNAGTINAVQRTVETAVDAADAAIALDRALEALRTPHEDGKP